MAAVKAKEVVEEERVARRNRGVLLRAGIDRSPAWPCLRGYAREVSFMPWHLVHRLARSCTNEQASDFTVVGSLHLLGRRGHYE